MSEEDQTKPASRNILKTKHHYCTQFLVKLLAKMSEDNLRQRRGQGEKEALRNRLEEMRRKMKVTEEKQERWNTAITFAK